VTISAAPSAARAEIADVGGIDCYSARPGADEVRLDLLGEDKSNVALYPTFQRYFRTWLPKPTQGPGTYRASGASSWSEWMTTSPAVVA
jgi:hypothetical protein